MPETQLHKPLQQSMDGSLGTLETQVHNPLKPPKVPISEDPITATKLTTRTKSTTKTVLPVSPILFKTNPADYSKIPASTSNLSTILSTLRNLLPERLSTRAHPLLRVYATQLSKHPHLTTLLTIQLLFTGPPVLLFVLFATGTIFFSLALALLSALVISALVLCGAMLVVVPAVVAAAVVGTVVWVGCRVGCYGLVWVREALEALEAYGGGVDGRKGEAGKSEDAVGMEGWKLEWEEWRRRGERKTGGDGVVG
ncbi:hypothetical protein PAAG_07331 [Paracoccidioides lutzii Pb01]|uniref:Uncharacterized protein n=1 Tax=Paracoccidioides lutzii (strain ATCC MYA-826 / Pb01) TaxID=502779 RepID=C1H990_PARBA|nr:hypothetical protein PAAG_07331 [Paracoccidioides lutzii Pb01]EEH36913.1 hypothetical protein PAAG_07331 [Paracoccidioides lutzii Pb01]